MATSPKSSSSKSGSAKAKSSRARVREYRQRMREKGMRQISFWVPDVNSPEFLEAARREMREIAQSEQEKDDMAFIESISQGIWDDE